MSDKIEPYPVGYLVSLPRGTAFDKELPPGWEWAEGQSLEKADFPELCAALNGAYGEDETTFKLPPLQNKALRYAMKVKEG